MIDPGLLVIALLALFGIIGRISAYIVLVRALRRYVRAVLYEQSFAELFLPNLPPATLAEATDAVEPGAVEPVKEYVYYVETDTSWDDYARSPQMRDRARAWWDEEVARATPTALVRMLRRIYRGQL